MSGGKEESMDKSKILIIGGCGYLGKFMVNASVSLGHPTFLYTRPNSTTSKSLLLKEFESMGVTIFYGELDEHDKLVSVLQQVEVVISTLAVPQHLDQLKIISAIKEAGTIKVTAPNLANPIFEVICIPRAVDRVIICRPPGNIASQLELISAWEKKAGRTLTRLHVPKGELVELSKTVGFPANIPVSILHSIFVNGDQMGYEVREEDLEASRLYPEYEYTSIDKYLDMCLVDPPKLKLAAFA